MAGLNKVMIIGNVGKIECKTTSTGPIVNLSIATSQKYTNKQGEKIENTEWHNIVCFQKIAEIVDSYVQKGNKIYIEGSLKTEKYTDKQGIERYATKIIANGVQLLERKEQSDGSYLPNPNSKEYNSMPFDDSIPF